MSSHPYLLDKINRKLVPVIPKEPDIHDYGEYVSEKGMMVWKWNSPTSDRDNAEALRKWKQQIASLPSPIPISESWNIDNEPEGKEYFEGKDFEIKQLPYWTHHPTYGYGCDNCCNGDRCEDDCKRVSRKKCPNCKGKGWFSDPNIAYPIQPPQESQEDYDFLQQVLRVGLLGYELSERQIENMTEKQSEALTQHFTIQRKNP